MTKGLYKYIGSSSFKASDGSSINIIYLAEQQPDGQYRPCTRRSSNGANVPGSLVSVDLYNGIMAKNFKIGEDVKPEFGSNGRLLGIDRF